MSGPAFASALALVSLTGCAPGAVPVAVPTTDAGTLSTCADFAHDLPETLAEKSARDVSPSDAPARAYGDPAIVVTCGVPLPSDYAPGGSCEVADGVGWFVPQADYDDQDADVTLTTVGYRPIVQVTVPHEYRPNTPAAVIAALAAPVKAHLRRVLGCT